MAPSTAATGTTGIAELALEHLVPGETLPAGARVVISRLGGEDLTVPPWAVVCLGRQDDLLSHADLVICGGGHGILSKTLLAGVPVVVVPGGGDQWELANRVVRQGSARLIRPLTVEALVAESIARKLPVYIHVAPQEQALKIHGLRAMFGEKYPPMVRVVSVIASTRRSTRRVTNSPPARPRMITMAIDQRPASSTM